MKKEKIEKQAAIPIEITCVEVAQSNAYELSQQVIAELTETDDRPLKELLEIYDNE